MTSLSTGLERDGALQEPREGLQHISWLWHSNHQMCPDVFFFLSVISLRWGKEYSLVVGNKGHSLAAVASLVENGLSATRASEAAAPSLQSTSSVVVPLAALQHAGSSWIRDRTCVSCIGKWILYHWATREAPRPHILMFTNALTTWRRGNII